MSSRSEPVDETEIQLLRGLVSQFGLDEVRRRTRLATSTITKAMAALPVSTGTRAAIREGVRR